MTIQEKSRQEFEKWWKANSSFKATLVTFKMNELAQMKQIGWETWCRAIEIMGQEKYDEGRKNGYDDGYGAGQYSIASQF
jgi:hypothetical protein